MEEVTRQRIGQQCCPGEMNRSCGEEALANRVDLVHDLLSPTPGCLDGLEMIAVHLQETAIILRVLAAVSHRDIHVVVGAALTGSLQLRESLIVCVEHHLLRLRPDRRARTAFGCDRSGRERL